MKKKFKKKKRVEVRVKAVVPGTTTKQSGATIAYDNRIWLDPSSTDGNPVPDTSGQVTLFLYPDTYCFAVTYNGVTRERVVEVDILQSLMRINIAAG